MSHHDAPLLGSTLFSSGTAAEYRLVHDVLLHTLVLTLDATSEARLKS